MTSTKHSSPVASSHSHKPNDDEYWNHAALLLLDEIITSSSTTMSPKHTHHMISGPKQPTFTDYHMSSTHHTISSPKPSTSSRHISSPKSTHHHISSPKSTHHHISSPKKSTYPYQTSQSQPSRPRIQPTLHASQPTQSSPRSQQSSQPKSPTSQLQQSSQPKPQSLPQSSSRSQQSTFNFLSNYNFSTYMTPSCNITLTSFQPCALSEAVEAAVLQFPPLHEIMPHHTTQPNRTVHPSLLPTAAQSQSTPTRYRLHPSHRKTPSLPNLSQQQQQSSIEPLPISSMWETPQYEKISS